MTDRKDHLVILSPLGFYNLTSPMIITIDGPAGVGKSSAARGLADRLGFQYLDTGAMYRTVALAALRAEIHLDDTEAIKPLLATMAIQLPPTGQVLLNEEIVTTLIRSQEVTSGSSRAATNPTVRLHLRELQRQIARERDIICEGRDQGTVVFPHATCKFFLVANPAVRARRRFEQLQDRGEEVLLQDIVEAQKERDARDGSRDIAPMVPAYDAVVLDTTQLTLDQVLERMEWEVRRCGIGSTTTGTS
ncbi:MAG: (d)CMP kinase [Gemmataceae bacterium]